MTHPEGKFRKLLMDCLVFEDILRYFYHVLAVEASSPSPHRERDSLPALSHIRFRAAGRQE